MQGGPPRGSAWRENFTRVGCGERKELENSRAKERERPVGTKGLIKIKRTKSGSRI